VSRSRRRWRKDAGVLVLFATSCAVLAVAQLAEVIVHTWVFPLLVAAGAGAAGYRLGQRRSAKPRGRVFKGTVIRTPDLSGEVARLQADNDKLRGDLEDARESAAAAWNAAADRSPQPARPISPRAARLLASPRSGVRSLYPEGDER
jgi:hypothetical protein